MKGLAMAIFFAYSALFVCKIQIIKYLIVERRESNRILALKTLKLLIPGMPEVACFPRLPNLLYGHCTAISKNSRTPEVHVQTVPSLLKEHSEARS
jgi:hypothetical protein